MASLPPFKSPGNSRRVLESSSLRDASLSQPLPQTPGAPSARRKSTKERTPRQVTALLSARKTRPSGSKSRRSGGLGLGGLLGGNGRGEDTPGGLIRALSRMPDLPPPTPEELQAESNAPQDLPSSDPVDSRNPLRDSILGQPLPGPLGEDSDPSSSSAPSSSARKPSMGGVKKAPRQSFFTTSLGRAYTPAFPMPPPSAGFNGLAEEGEGEEGLDDNAQQDEDIPSSGSDVAASLLSHSQRSRAASLGAESAASVEKARRISRISSGFGGSPGGRGRMSEFGESELGEEDGEGRRFSAVSGMGSEKGGARSSFGSILGGRPSLAPSTAPGGDDGEEAEQFEFGNGEEYQWQEEMGGGGEEEEETQFEGQGEGERIPWESKGKGRASDFEREVVNEYDVEGEEDVDGGWQQEEAQYGSAEEEEAGQMAASLISRQRLPPAPSLAKVAANRKKRVALGLAAGPKSKKKKIQRYTPNGDPVPDLPAHRQKALLQHFLGPNVRIDEQGMEEVMDASQEFFAQLMKDASAYARHAGRKHLVNEQDLVMLLTRQHILTSKNRLQTHGRRLGLDRELQSVLDGIGSSASAAAATAGSGKGKGRKRKAIDGGREGGGRKQGKGKAREESEDEEDDGRVSYAEESE